jgi:thiosulfate reductase cytochrome b subunit
MSAPGDVIAVARWKERGGLERVSAYEHPLYVRLAHWMIAVSLVVMAASGLRIFLAFPSFGDKVPQVDFWNPPAGITLGGWLGGALQWHFTFMWVFGGAAVMYLIGQVATGRFRMVLFTPRDVPGVWPMVRHYFLRGPRPPIEQPYNPLQKLAYTATLLLGTLSIVSGIALYKSAQYPFLVTMLGGYRFVRGWHFFALCGFAAFVPGHIVMVVLHGWRNFAAMLTGWKDDPEYLPAAPPAPVPVSAPAPAPADGPLSRQ